MFMTGGRQEGKSLGQWVSRNSPSPLALGLGLCAKKVPLDPPKYESQADADGRMSRERDRDAAAMMPVVNARAEVTDRPTARDRSGAQNTRIKGMGKGARSLARSPARSFARGGRGRWRDLRKIK